MYGRMGDEKNDRDTKAMGGNPCLEQTLESFEMCCLVETFPDKHECLEDYLTTLRSDEVPANIDRSNEMLHFSGICSFVPFPCVRLRRTKSEQGALAQPLGGIAGCPRSGAWDTQLALQNIGERRASVFVCLSRFAFMYAKTVTLGGTHWEQTNEILFRNRRIGCRYALIDPSRHTCVRCSLLNGKSIVCGLFLSGIAYFCTHVAAFRRSCTVLEPI